MTPKIGTLRELDLRPGDVVQDTDDGEIGVIDENMVWRSSTRSCTQSVKDSTAPVWTVIARAERAEDRASDSLEQQAAAAVRAAIDNLNRAVEDAGNIGLEVEIRTVESAALDRPLRPHVTARVSKPF